MVVEDFTLISPFESLPEIPEKVAPEYILRTVQEHVENGKSTFIIDANTEEEFIYEEFEVITRSIASAFYKRGFRKGDTVIFLTYDMVKLGMFFTGVWRCNGIVRASYPEDTVESLLERVEDSRAGWIYCEESFAEMCLSVAEKIYWDVEVIVAGKAEGCTSIYDFMMDDGTEMPEPDLTEDDTAMVLCTSGTTGVSKGAAISHAAIVNLIVGITEFPLSREKPNLFVTKGTHVSGCLLPLASLCVGNPCIVMASITKTNIFKAIDVYKPGLIFGFPTFLLLLVIDPEAKNYDFSSLETVLSGGAPVTPQIVNTVMQLPRVKAVLNIYGLTEVLLVASHVNFGDIEEIKIPDMPPESIGKLLPGVSLQIRDLETEEILEANCVGELCIQSPGLFSGYLNNPEGTNKAFTTDGWFKSGDVGYYDENEFIFMVDRAKEIFKYFGNHVSPTEIEKVISEHPDVGQVCVIGVLDPNGGGHIPRAFVVLKEDAQCTSEELIQFANEKLADYKHIRGGVYFLQELPKGKTGKVTRSLVEQLIVSDS